MGDQARGTGSGQNAKWAKEGITWKAQGWLRMRTLESVIGVQDPFLLPTCCAIHLNLSELLASPI